MPLSRRTFLAGAPLFLAGCVSGRLSDVAPTAPARVVSPYYLAMYAAVEGEPFPVPAPDLTKIDPRFYRQEVAYSSGEIPGTLIVDTPARFLYLQMEDRRALRYGIGVGKAGLAFEGEAVVQYKRAWPRWRPTDAMMAREPERYGHLSAGMEPGPTNPLGARALYLFRGGEDTLYRIHGTNEDWSIGRSISSGCIRLLNQDVIDLHRRVLDGTKVVVLQGPSAGTV
ncbi:L,D-transpeptidase [Aureimonas sp. SK2]|uniref:L,D-transpeptidase n=1 Tax=Aureimonas sp. SK2 TaxID=3015992 RepID=UPI002444D773|nr:L,D-transpeptidase [Aureimonas sp. SK2]